MKRITLPLLAGLLLLGACMDQPLPTALAPEGAAFSASGAECVVTSTADDGAGSLRALIADDGCATITFDVAGPIEITGTELSIDRPLTIAGPANGITVGRTAGVGAIFFIGQSGDVEISRLTITGGIGTIRHEIESIYAAGGIFNYGGTLTLTSSTVSGNSATPPHITGSGVGGGIHNAGGTMTLTNSTVSGNTAGYGGGGISNRGTMTLTNSTVSGNTGGSGGGIYNQRTLTLMNSTISGNWGLYGGGINNTSASTLTLRNTIVANSLQGGNCDSPLNPIIDDGYNLVEDGSCITASTSISGNPLLGPLADNGGPTLTHALLTGSPALDAIPTGTNGCGTDITTDQRGVSRPQGSACDIGAFERVQQAPSSPVGPVLAFFDLSVANGTLVGSGSGASAQNRLGALRNMLTTAADLLAQDDVAGACGQLLQAYRRTDGEPQPPDFAAGASAPLLAAQIQALRGTLGCP